MKVIILAGGMGTRLSEYTKSIPKPMVKIKKIPIIIHIMNHYSKSGFKDFIIASTVSSMKIKSLNCFPSEHENFLLFKQLLMIIGINLFKSCRGP